MIQFVLAQKVYSLCTLHCNLHVLNVRNRTSLKDALYFAIKINFTLKNKIPAIDSNTMIYCLLFFIRISHFERFEKSFKKS